jgi:hypothetical protein
MVIIRREETVEGEVVPYQQTGVNFTNILCGDFLYLKLGIILFRRKKIGRKAALKMLVKLTTELQCGTELDGANPSLSIIWPVTVSHKIDQDSPLYQLKPSNIFFQFGNPVLNFVTLPSN